MTLVRRLARPMLAVAFVAAGVDALRRPAARADRAAPLVSAIADQTGIPDDPELLIRAGGATMTVAGVMFATGRMPRLASTLLALTLLPTTAVGHPFWEETDPQAREQERLLFLKNLGLLGGALLGSVDTAGKPGLSWRAQNVAKSAKREAKLASAQARRKLS